MSKRVKLCLLLLMACTLNCGCYDAAEVDDQVYALTLGLENGVNDKLRLTIQYPTYKSSGGGGEGQGDKDSSGMEKGNTAPGFNISSVESPSIIEALDMYGMAISRRVSLKHAKTLIISEDLAKEGIEEILAPLARFRDTRSVMNILVVKGSAQKFIQENKPLIGESLSKSMELMFTQARNTSFFPKIVFHDFYRNIFSTYEQGYAAYAGLNDFSKFAEEANKGKSKVRVGQGYLPGEIPRSGEGKDEYTGTAVFNTDKMVGALNSEETRAFMMVSGKFKRGFVVIRDKSTPDEVITLDFRPSRKPEIKAYFKNKKPIIEVVLKMEADIASIQSRINYEDTSNIEKLNKQAAEYVLNQVTQMLGKVQYVYKSDIFGFGRKLAGYFPTIQEWEEYRWLNHFEEAKISVKVDVNIRRTGLMVESVKAWYR